MSTLIEWVVGASQHLRRNNNLLQMLDIPSESCKYHGVDRPIDNIMLITY